MIVVTVSQNVLLVRMMNALDCVVMDVTVGSGCAEIVAITWDVMGMMYVVEKSLYRLNVCSPLVSNVKNLTINVNTSPGLPISWSTLAQLIQSCM